MARAHFNPTYFQNLDTTQLRRSDGSPMSTPRYRRPIRESRIWTQRCREMCSNESRFLTRPRFSRGGRISRIGGAAGRNDRDILISAHAAIAGYRLLTRGAARYRGYLPGPPLITPD